MQFRAFISVDVEAGQGMRELSRALGETGGSLKLVSLDIIHLTLKFLGDTDESLVPRIEEIIRDSVKGVEPFELQFRGTGAFPNLGHMKVIWVGVEGGEALTEIAKKIDNGVSELGFKKEKRAFSPHITVARVKGGRNKDRVAATVKNYRGLDFGSHLVSSVRLKQSELLPGGPRYTTIVDVPLEG